MTDRDSARFTPHASCFTVRLVLNGKMQRFSENRDMGWRGCDEAMRCGGVECSASLRGAGGQAVVW